MVVLLTLLMPFIGALLMLLLPRPEMVGRWVAAGCCAAVALLGLFLFLGDDVATGCDLEWIPQWGARFVLAADAPSALLLTLSGVVFLAGCFFSWEVKENPRAWWFFYLWLLAAISGVFVARDALLFLLFYELAILPKYFLIAGWGHENRNKAAMKLVLYSLLGGAAALAGLIFLRTSPGVNGFGFAQMAAAQLSVADQSWIFLLIFLGFGVLGGLWPFHSWAPSGHVAAPVAASMVLAGVVMKLGAYGCWRLGVGFLPEGALACAGLVSTLGAINLIYGALVAFTQKDAKYVVAFSSVSHMGFVFLGLGAMNQEGFTGAIYQMMSHGLIGAAFFALAGGVLYRRMHTRELDSLRRLQDRIPGLILPFTLVAAASAGLPGFCGFIAEIHVLIGTWKTGSWHWIPVFLGILLALCYTLRFWYDLFARAPLALQMHEVPAPDNRWSAPEIGGLAVLLLCIILTGIFPEPILDRIMPAAIPYSPAAMKGAP